MKIMPLDMDGSGNYIPDNSPSIDKGEFLLRGLPKGQFSRDIDTKEIKISSQFFSQSSTASGPGGMSVKLKCYLLSEGFDPVKVCEATSFPEWVTIEVEKVRALGLLVGYTPVESDKFHADVFNNPASSEFNRRTKRQLAKNSNVFIGAPR